MDECKMQRKLSIFNVPKKLKEIVEGTRKTITGKIQGDQIELGTVNSFLIVEDTGYVKLSN